MKSAPHEQLLEALRKVAAGGLYASEGVLQLLIHEAAGGEANTEGLDGLSSSNCMFFACWARDTTRARSPPGWA